MKINIHKSIFNEVYYPYLTNYINSTEIYYGGAGSGKSVWIAQKLLVKALKSKRKILIIRKVMATHKDSTWQLLLDTLAQFNLTNYCSINKSTYSIELPNESVFLFKGMDDSEKIKSITGITDIWCEEATELSVDDYEQLTLRLRAKVKNLQFFISFNPISKANWVYKRWFTPDKEPSPKTLILHTTYKDNRFLPQSYVDNLKEKERINPTYYKIYALGEFASLDKLVFTNWRKEEFNYKELKGELLVGLDWGFTNDATALIASIVNEEEKKIYIFDEHYQKGLTNPQIAQIIKDKGLSKSIIICDSAEPKSISELKNEGILRVRASEKGKGSILTGIQKLQQYQIIVRPQLTHIIEEFENYSWQKDRQTNEYINKPIDSFNHCIDALRYSLQCVGAKLRTINKNLL